MRRNKSRMLELADVGRYLHAPELGATGVHHGTASKGSSPKCHSMLTVWDWAPGVIDQWTAHARPLRATDANQAPWPSERAERIGLQPLNKRFVLVRDELSLAPGVDCHSLRRSYLTRTTKTLRRALDNVAATLTETRQRR